MGAGGRASNQTGWFARGEGYQHITAKDRRRRFHDSSMPHSLGRKERPAGGRKREHGVGFVGERRENELRDDWSYPFWSLGMIMGMFQPAGHKT